MNPLVLIILDGFGYTPEEKGNSIALADAPYWKKIWKEYPHTLIETSGEAVGLPEGVMGNSEVGHLTIGSGRIHYQDLTKISNTIKDGSFFKNEILLKAFQTAKENNSNVHFIGLLSDAGVHSHLDHLKALVRMARTEGASSITVHAFMDGRDTSPKSGIGYLQETLDLLKPVQGQLGTMIGRYYAMDRDQRWERIQIAIDALVSGTGEQTKHPIETLQKNYDAGVTDEFLKPIVVENTPRIQDNDVVIFFNYRPDRAREITEKLTSTLKLSSFVCMTEYDKKLSLPIAFPQTRPKRVLAEIISEQGWKQFHTAETEKYAHVTYFLNGGVETPFPGEERSLIPSPKEVATYDEKPEMSARKVCEGVVKKIQEGFEVIFVNFANPDMLGHTGKLEETIQSIEVIDECLEKIVTETLAKNGTVLITADHGNCEEMFDKDGGPHTQHTTNPVPFLLINQQLQKEKLRQKGGGLQDVAPTILALLKVQKPIDMTGTSLIEFN